MTIQYEKHVTLDSDFADQMEAWSTKKTHLEFTVKNDAHVHEHVRGHIADLFAKDHKDHFRLADGRSYRLDQITGVRELASHEIPS